MSILLKDAVRLMSPNDTYSLYSRLHERLSKLVSQKKLIEAEILSIDNDGEDDPYMCANGKRECIYNKPDIERDLYSGKNIRNLDKIMEKYGVEGVYKVNGRNTWKVSQSNRNKLAQALTLFMPFERSENQTLQMFIVSNLKGGSGKSTLASNLAAALATQTMNSYRIGLIDLDPQGSATDIYLPYLDDDALSVGDLLLEEFELDDNETFESVCRDAFLEVNIPNVKVLPARTADARYDFYSKMKGLESQEKGVVYHSHDQLMRIVEAVKDDFDIILFDTPPQLNEAAFAAHFVATSSIIPMRSEQNDRD
ncbi:ParA family protein, partial [Vibrio anguillarum]|nr:ParA family protein [Vibrio anguillarum]